jgi:enoyl-CoA hydratase/carnithine racemase
MDQDLLLDIADRVATITINRPDKRNSFTDSMVLQWVSWLRECQQREDVAVIVFTGSADAFSSGGDMGGLKDKAEQTPVAAKERMMGITQSLARTVLDIDKPIIAAVNGLAVGGGMDIALMCDIRLATASARFAETYGKMGLVPGVGGAWFLPRIVGTSAALDLFWTARWVKADEALSLGLVNRVFPDDDFREGVAAYAAQIAQAAPLSVRYIKRLVHQGLNSDLATHFDAASSLNALLRAGEDHKEALAAFKDRRPPVFTGN